MRIYILEITPISNVLPFDVADENKVKKIEFKQDDEIEIFNVKSGKRFKKLIQDISIFDDRIIVDNEKCMVLTLISRNSNDE